LKTSSGKVIGYRLPNSSVRLSVRGTVTSSKRDPPSAVAKKRVIENEAPAPLMAAPCGSA
jgi:hypothetical protein